MHPTGTRPAESSREPKPNLCKRRCVRHKVHTPAYASLNWPSTGMVVDLSEILDISEEGMSIQASLPLEVNRTLNLCLDLSETKPCIYTTGRVIWSDQRGRAGIRFPEMADSSRRQLKEWLFLNAIVAVDHATEPTPQPELEAPEEKSADANAQVATSQREDETEARVLPDYPSMLTELAVVRRAVLIGPDLDASLQLVAERALTFTRASGAAIALSQGEEMICRATAGADAPGLGARLTIGSGFSGECVRTGHLLSCDDSETDPSVDRESCRALGIRSMIAVPIRFGDAVVGLLEVFSPKPNAFGANDDTVLQRLVDIVPVTLNRASQASARSGGLRETVRAVEDLPAGTPVATAAPDESHSPRSRRILLGAVPVTLVFVLLWLIAPWIKSWTGSSSRTGSPPKSTQRLPVSKTPAPAAAGANDLESLRRLAKQGDSVAQFALGAHYATGEDVKQDYSEALRWFSMAAEQGHPAAQATLGLYYWSGRGVPPDLSKAYFWSVLAEASGDKTSKYLIPVLASRMPRAQVVAAQQQANDWLKQHQLTGKTPSGDR